MIIERSNQGSLGKSDSETGKNFCCYLLLNALGINSNLHAGSDESIESEKEPEEEKAESVILPPLTQPKKVELVGLTIVREY